MFRNITKNVLGITALKPTPNLMHTTHQTRSLEFTTCVAPALVTLAGHVRGHDGRGYDGADDDHLRNAVQLLPDQGVHGRRGAERARVCGRTRAEPDLGWKTVGNE